MSPLKFLLGALLALTVAGCTVIASEYRYKPRREGEIPATLQFSYDLSGDSWVYVRYVKDTYLFRDDGKISKAVEDNQIKLSPGKTHLTLLVSSNGTQDNVDITLDVKTAEQYRLSMRYGEIGIHDKLGNRVAVAKYDVAY